MSSPVLTGPVVGKVTAREARVLLECSADSFVLARAEASSGCHQQVEQRLGAHVPGVFHFKGLQPSTRYDIKFEGVDSSVCASFTTLPEDCRRLTILCVSCNDFAGLSRPHAWQGVQSRVKSGDVDLVLHLGDQIYADSVFWKAAESFGQRPLPDWEQETRELFRNVYRRAWSVPVVAAVLANTSNLMIWDDHEIRDNWSAVELSASPTLDGRIVHLGREVYREYQRQLWDDGTALASDPDAEFHAHRFGSIGLVFLDQRGARQPEGDALPYLGPAQWRALEALLSENGGLAGTQTLIIACSVPLVFLKDRLTALAARVVQDLRDQWSYPPYRAERLRLLHLLRQWQEARDVRRVVILGGDAHTGLLTDIFYEGVPVFPQLTTSPIASSMLPEVVLSFLRNSSRKLVSAGDGFTYSHHSWRDRPNFGLVRISDGVDLSLESE